MLLLAGFLIVFFCTIGGFMMAGGNPAVLLHLSEFVIVGGMSIGMLVSACDPNALKRLMGDLKNSVAGGGADKEEFLDLLKLMYELFMIARRNGLIALDEHVTDPQSSSILSKYPSFLAEEERVNFLCNALRPIIDGKIKPEQLEELLDNEIYSGEQQAHETIKVLQLIGDSLPGIGICAAVLGVINTMGSVSEGPEVVGYKVAAALTGTFLGIWGAYGFVNPLAMRVEGQHKAHFLYFNIMAQAISGFAKGLAPLMAIEISRRSLTDEMKPEADELEEILKQIGRK